MTIPEGLITPDEEKAYRNGFRGDYGHAYLIGAIGEASTRSSGVIWGPERALARVNAMVELYRDVKEQERREEDA